HIYTHSLGTECPLTCTHSHTRVPSHLVRYLSDSQPPFCIQRPDPLVLTVRSLDRTINLYTKVLGMEATTFKGGRKALSFGVQKINLHVAGKEFEPKAAVPSPGSADLCLITEAPLSTVAQHLKVRQLPEGPIIANPTGPMGSHLVSMPSSVFCIY
uniref:VOC domain-containing protein n=1 Tax=Xenopus tropicalis TaxID=8364 RepID=A0A6I8PQC1_XENTR